MNLLELTPERIQRGPVPLDDLLPDSVYYPASRSDGTPVKLCNGAWRSLGVDSYVYCDYGFSVEGFLADAGTMYGYHLLAHRLLDPSEYIPKGWQPEFIPEKTRFGGGGYWDNFGPEELPHGACWAVFERDPGFGPVHGPERFSLLYVCGEGLATFQQLYCSRGISPKMVCFIQCWGFAGNWTDFSRCGSPFHQTLMKHRECTPEWLLFGAWGGMDGAVRLRNLGDIGVRCIGYMTERIIEARFGVRPARMPYGQNGRILDFSSGSHKYLGVSISHHMAYAVYDVTESPHDFLTIAGRLVLGDPGRKMGAERKLECWAGLKGFGPDGPVLDATIDWRRLDRHPDIAKAIAVARSIVEIYGRNGATQYSPLIERSWLWARDVLELTAPIRLENGLPSFQRSLSLMALREWERCRPYFSGHVCTRSAPAEIPEEGRFRIPEMFEGFVR